jgi:iron complex outermembrane receptor protein
MHLRIEPENIDTTGRAEQLEGASPRHQALFRWSMDLPGNWQWDPQARYTDELSSQDIPAYWSMDMRVAWRPVTACELALVGQNLLQSRHPEFDPDQQMQRGFYGKATWRW